MFISKMLGWLLLLCVVPGVGFSRDPDTRFVPRDKPFAVYGGNCSRSIQLQSSHDSLNDAITAANELRKQELKWITIHTGAWQETKGVQMKYHVFCRGLRCGIWKPSGQFDDLKAAEDQAKKIATVNSPTQIVQVYEKK